MFNSLKTDLTVTKWNYSPHQIRPCPIPCSV